MSAGPKRRVRHRHRVKVCAACKHPMAMHGKTAGGRPAGCKAARGKGRCDCDGFILTKAGGGMRVHSSPWEF